MSTLYLGTDPPSLAERLAALIEDSARRGDCFEPIPIIVPTRYLGKWLRLWLARRLGAAVNLQFQYLENAAWDMLQRLDSRRRRAEKLDDLTLRLLIVSLFLDEADADAALGALRAYLQRQPGAPGRDQSRRAWQLADRLAVLVREYEYHRQTEFVQRWLLVAGGPGAGPQDLEHGQGELFRQIMGKDGLRDRLGQAENKILRTLPQYAAEVMGLPAPLPRPDRPHRVHLFGITQVSALHVRILGWLGNHYDLRLYHLNPLCGRLDDLAADASPTPAALRQTADLFRAANMGQNGQPAGTGLLASWGQAGAESLWGLADLLDRSGRFTAELVPPHPRARTGVLGRLQEHLLGRDADGTRLAPDTTLQVVSCPGIYREVETVYHSILDNLRRDECLQQTDIAVLVTDMPRYRPVLQAVFDRGQRRVQYNLADFSAAELSVFGHGVLGLLDLALESFTRSRVFATLLNPCFLARLGVDREQALVWLEWAEALGIYHGWDRQERRERGYADTPLYNWRLGLQRLRLGRIMEVADEDADAPSAHFQDVVPFADLASSDREQLNAFCRAVEGLLPVLARLRDWHGNGADWAAEIRRLVQTFLAIPPDRPEEEEVRGELLGELQQLDVLDHLQRPQGREARLPLALVREFIQDRLECRVGTQGEYLTGGVTISPLQPLRLVPFEIIYVLGLGEGLFPGVSAVSALDLRGRRRCDGDILPPESNRFLLVEALLAARRKVYLLYNDRDLQNDRTLYPSTPLNQLCRHLEQHVVEGKFEAQKAPLCGNDLRYLARSGADEKGDALANYTECDRLLALADGLDEGRVTLDARQMTEVAARRKAALPNFGPAVASPETPKSTATVSLHELARFLRCPAEASVRRHLGLDDDEEVEPQDDEPFFTALLPGYRLGARFLRRFVRRAIPVPAEQTLAQWRQWFADLYEDGRLRGRTPDGAFARVDRGRLEEALHKRIAGPHGLAAFIAARAGAHFCGPVLVGESVTPVGARRTFAALQLGDLRLIGSEPFVWRSEEALDVLVITGSGKEKVPPESLSVPMLGPLLVYLALNAGTEPGPDGLSSADWLGERELRLHVAHDDGITAFAYAAGATTPAQARAYLAELGRDFLDRGSFDLLPFDLAVKDPGLRLPFALADQEILTDYRTLATADSKEGRRLRQTLGLDEDEEPITAWTGEEVLAWLRDRYPVYYQQRIDDDEESAAHRAYRPMKLMRIVEAKVPADAWDKMRRRFRLLQPPARPAEVSGTRKGRGRGHH